MEGARPAARAVRHRVLALSAAPGAQAPRGATDPVVTVQTVGCCKLLAPHLSSYFLSNPMGFPALLFKIYIYFLCPKLLFTKSLFEVDLRKIISTNKINEQLWYTMYFSLEKNFVSFLI